MQAMAVMIVLLIVFLIGIGLIFLGIALMVANRIAKKRGSKRKVLKVLSIIVLVVGLVFVVPPVSWIMFLRSGNGGTDDTYVNTGTMLVWDKGGGFTYHNEKYVSVTLEKNRYNYMDNTVLEDSKAAFNIKDRMNIWGMIFNNEEREVMYRVKNGAGTVLFSDGMVYCPKKDKAKVLAYYQDERNLYYYDEKGDDGKVIPFHFTDQERSFLDHLNTTKTKYTVPDIEDYEIYKGSKDGVWKASLELIVYKGNLFWTYGTEVKYDPKNDVDYLEAYKLPDSISKKIKLT